MRLFALEIAAGNFAPAAGHSLPTLRLVAVCRRTDGVAPFSGGRSERRIRHVPARV
jgi:hypothetical protein